MSRSVAIAVDAMGGDRAPEVVVEGTLAALAEYEDLAVHLVGRTEVLEPLLAGASRDGLTLHHAPDVIGMDESPAKALRQKPEASISVCVRLLAKGDVRGLVSAGNTGAVVASSMFVARLLPGVHRPGIAVTLPTRRGPTVLCDVGANIQPKPAHYLQYAVMAAAFSHDMHGVESPRVALLNIGTEETKGGAGLRGIRALLEEAGRAGVFDFVGAVEGNHIFEGAADVVVCDGFVGNTILKAAEGVGRVVVEEFAAICETELTGMSADDKELVQSPLRRGLRRLVELTDYTTYGGAPLLGMDGCAIIAHGRSDGRAIKHAIRASRDFARREVNRHIVSRLEELSAKGITG